MSASVQSAAQGIATADVITAFLDRLRTGLTYKGAEKPESFVRLVASPDTDLAEYRPRPGISVRVQPPQPEPRGGAGRSALRVTRVFEVFIITTCLLDSAGSDTKAVLNHAALEDAVVDRLHDTPPNNRDGLTRIGIKLQWVPGGEEVRRKMKKDAGQLMSVLLFACEYVADVQLYHE
jgi:hypothetical protein